MQRISLKIKALLITGLLLLLCIGGLCIVYYLSLDSKNLFLALPADISSPKINIQKIEEFSESEFLLTYEIPAAERVSLAYAEYPVTMIGTNSNYSQILGLIMTEGAFFSKQAWTGKLKHAVLNEKAAIEIFGSYKINGSRFRIRGETWLVTGVIQDHEEDKARIYIPSTVFGGEAAALAINTSGGLDTAYAVNSLKTQGIREGSFYFMDLGIQNRLLLERILVLPLLFLGFLLLSLLRPVIIRLTMAISAIKKELDRFYMSEIIKTRKNPVIKAILWGLGLVLMPIAALFSFVNIVSICLHWQDIPSLFNINREFFQIQLDRITGLKFFSLGFFILSLILLVIFFIYLNFIINKSIKAKKTFP